LLRRIVFLPVIAVCAAYLASVAPLRAQTGERPIPAASASPAGNLGSASPAAPAASAAPSASPSASPTPPFNRLGWRSIGPGISGGRVASVVGSARNPLLYYVGAAGGGVWKTRNAGATWQPVFDKQGVSSIGAIAIDPTNDDVVWVGTGETNPRNDVSYGNGVYRSTDGGKTWTALGLEKTLQISSIVVDPANPNHVVVGAMGDFFADSPDRGIYVTDDAGKTWHNTLYLGPQSGVSDLAADPKDPNVLYAGMWQFRRQPWTFTSGGPDDGLFKSIDGGASWTRLTGHGLPEGITGRIGLAVSASDPKRVYALIESKAGILWRSDDAGATWAMVSKNTLVDQRPFYFTHLAVDPKNADRVYGVSEMLSESKDGGKTFKEIAHDVHVDYHSIWIAPNDPNRIMVGEDGGYALTLDGEHWSDNENLPIGQIYHVGYSDDTPYRMCESLQDNNAFCGPSNALDPNGNPNRDWERVIGGDGMWAWPDPADPNAVWTDLQDGNVSIYDRTTKRNTFVQPWLGTSHQSFDISTAKYRFNWDSPIAFAPWDPHIVWYGGDAVFQTRDRGKTWRAISPDLTLNDKSHQQPSGGPLALDVSGAEYTDTILDIEGSPRTANEIWVGTDDGYVQLTRDGGAHWTNVTPPHIPPFGRFEMVAPSPLVAGTAYAVYDRHYLGDRNPYAFVTHDYGATWTSIAAGLPALQPVRSIRPDIHDAGLVFAGTENGIFASYDGGAAWRPFNLNMPPVAVYDIRIQPRYDDLLVATHGRSLYIFDDLTPVQQLGAAQAAGVMLFAPKPAYEFASHADEEESYTAYYGKNPPSGAVIAFYQAKPGPQPPDVRIYDATHHLVRAISGTHCVEEKALPFVTNDAGLNRVVWDLRESGPVRWKGAARESFKGPRTGPGVVPGAYSVEMTLGGKTLRQTVDVRPDPRLALTAADYALAHAFVEAQEKRYSNVDAALNRLDAVEHDARKRGLGDLADRAHALRGTLTADYHNDEDSIQRPGEVREDLQSLTGFRAGSNPPSAATRDLAARIDAEYDGAMKGIKAFFATDVAAADAKLKAAGSPPITESEPEPPLDCATAED
jgi:photosystem II stability/assembly factor-like uncharacterized protein